MGAVHQPVASADHSHCALQDLAEGEARHHGEIPASVHLVPGV